MYNVSVYQACLNILSTYDKYVTQYSAQVY